MVLDMAQARVCASDARRVIAAPWIDYSNLLARERSPQLDPSAAITRGGIKMPQTACFAFLILSTITAIHLEMRRSGAIRPCRCRQAGSGSSFESSRQRWACSTSRRISTGPDRGAAQCFHAADIVDTTVKRSRRWADVRNGCAAQVIAAQGTVMLRHKSALVENRNVAVAGMGIGHAICKPCFVHETRLAQPPSTPKVWLHIVGKTAEQNCSQVEPSRRPLLRRRQQECFGKACDNVIVES